MCIAQAVGRKAVNKRDDVRTVQILINLNLYKLIPLRPLEEDGGIGDITIGAIEEFQHRVLGIPKPDGKVDPGGKTLGMLRDGLPTGLTEAKLRGIMIRASAATVAKYFPGLNQKMPAHDISNALRMAHFLAQLAHESGEFRYSEEIASGAAYEGRTNLGNTQPGDGKRFKGRGLIQLTGRSNYKKFGDARGKDFTTDAAAASIATDAGLAVDVSCWFWSEHGLNALADADNVKAITKTINGGYNGLEDRKAKLARAKFFLPR